MTEFKQLDTTAGRARKESKQSASRGTKGSGSKGSANGGGWQPLAAKERGGSKRKSWQQKKGKWKLREAIEEQE